jgi:nitroreductase
MKRRYSCRRYQDKPIAPETQSALSEFLASNGVGPLGARARFKLIASTDENVRSLKGLGTYGMIKNPSGFIVGAVEKGPRDCEDFGYLMENAILRATALGLGTCWLGGSFTQSGFAKKIGLASNELLPAVTSVGYSVEENKTRDWVRKSAGASSRIPEEKLFFVGGFDHPITDELSGPYQEALERVQWGPSASNRQPWRIVRTGTGWHFYLERTKGYGKGSWIFKLLRLADLQKVDMGIAMCHFEMSAQALGFKGDWVTDDPHLGTPDRTEYSISWRPVA